MKNIYSAQLNNLEQIAHDIAAFCQTESISKSDQFAINLAIDEMFTNIVSYGYKMDTSGEVEIQMRRINDVVEISITDSAPEFDPTEQVATPDTTSDIDNRRIGGLGVFFATMQMDKISHEYRDKKNILTMSKNLSK